MLSQVVAKNKGDEKWEKGKTVEKRAKNMRILGKSPKNRGVDF